MLIPRIQAQKFLSFPDIKQCSVNNGGCQHICTELIPGFQCSCLAGYMLASNSLNCTGGQSKGCRVPVLIVSFLSFPSSSPYFSPPSPPLSHLGKKMLMSVQSRTATVQGCASTHQGATTVLATLHMGKSSFQMVEGAPVSHNHKKKCLHIQHYELKNLIP